MSEQKLKMIEKEIEGVKYKIQELSTDAALDMSDIKVKSKLAKQLLMLSVIEPKIDLKLMPARIGNKLVNEINVLNGFDKVDFPTVQEPQPKPTSGN